MKRPALALSRDGDELVLVVGNKRYPVALPFDAQKVAGSLVAGNVDPIMIRNAVLFLEQIRNDLSRPS
jgi:hypothetical protein